MSVSLGIMAQCFGLIRRSCLVDCAGLEDQNQHLSEGYSKMEKPAVDQSKAKAQTNLSQSLKP